MKIVNSLNQLSIFAKKTPLWCSTRFYIHLCKQPLKLVLKWETEIWQTLLLFQILYTDHTFLRSVSYANAAIDNRLWSTSQKGFEYIFKRSWKRAIKNSLSSWYVLKTSSTHHYKMSWRHFCKTSWKYLSKESWKCLEDVLEMSWRRLEDVFKTSWQDVLKTSSTCMTRWIYWSWSRRLETSPEDEDEIRLQDVFIKTSVCWVSYVTLSRCRC